MQRIGILEPYAKYVLPPLGRCKDRAPENLGESSSSRIKHEPADVIPGVEQEFTAPPLPSPHSSPSEHSSPHASANPIHVKREPSDSPVISSSPLPSQNPSYPPPYIKREFFDPPVSDSNASPAPIKNEPIESTVPQYLHADPTQCMPTVECAEVSLSDAQLMHAQQPAQPPQGYHPSLGVFGYSPQVTHMYMTIPVSYAYVQTYVEQPQW